jgi:hypothetical protein
MKTPALTALFLFVSLCSFAQNLSALAGAPSQSLSGAAVCRTDIWSAHHNVGATAQVKQPGAGLSHQNRFLVNEFKLTHFALVYPSSLGSFNLVAAYFGFNEYNETKLGIGYARCFGKRLCVGLSVNYHHYFVAEASAQPRAFTGELGLLVTVLPSLHLGVHLFNFNQAKLGDGLHEQLPLVARVGVEYAVSKALKLSGEIKKPVGLHECYALALEYMVAELLTLRTGVGFPNAQNSVGVGIRLKGLRINFAYAYRLDLGSNLSASLHYLF